MLAEDESSVRVLLLQGGEPLAKLVMNDLDENSNLTLTVEVSLAEDSFGRTVESPHLALMTFRGGVGSANPPANTTKSGFCVAHVLPSLYVRSV